MPRTEDPSTLDDPTPTTAKASIASTKDLSVLVADDHPANRKVLEIMLMAKVRVRTVENGQQAVEAARSEAFDVILMDMQMPVMDGLAATRQIRAEEAQQGRPHTRILMLTANALDEHVEMGRQAGADGHLNKPITMAHLYDAIRGVAEG